LQPFVIPVKGLKAGKTALQRHLTGEFFAIFENEEIKDASLDASVVVDFDGRDIVVSCTVKGSVTVTCDRCLSDLVLSVDTEFETDEYDGLSDIDLSQDIYDYVCISLPMCKVHPDGECDEETVKYLSK